MEYNTGISSSIVRVSMGYRSKKRTMVGEYPAWDRTENREYNESFKNSDDNSRN
jgi:hypothetical protein